jgi:hypothetical protein
LGFVLDEEAVLFFLHELKIVIETTNRSDKMIAFFIVLFI